MPYDRRLQTTASSFSSTSANHGVDDIIELRPWDAQIPDHINQPPHTYQSTDELLEIENQRLFQLSPRHSVSSNEHDIPGPWEGWQLGARLCLLVVAAVLILNITVTAWAAKTFGLQGGIGTIHTGACTAIKRAGLWLHIAINILSTIMLGASNYCMQCLSSPTRIELDRAHAKRTWLDIGIQSVRNLTKIQRLRMVLWILLAASSLPLHLIFNSAIFVSLTANEYTVAAVTEDFLKGAAWTMPDSDSSQQLIVTEMQQNASAYEKLDVEECIRDYGVDYLSDRRHVLAVVAGQSSNPVLGTLDWTYGSSLNSWICNATLGDNMTLETISIVDFDCSIPVALAGLTEDGPWSLANQSVEYCLSEQVLDQCRLQFAVPIMVVVLCCNFAKLVCMVVTIWKCKASTMVTLGDALTSFLVKPDSHTVGMCIATKKDFDDGAWPDNGPRRWADKWKFRFQAVGLRRWLVINGICTVAVVALSILLRFAIQNTTTASDIATLYSLGFGTVTASSLIRWNNPMLGSPGVMKNVLLANSPQVILSLLYIVYNRMYTCMSFSKEWNDFAHHRRPLRVTSPRGSQRSTYFLSLPYRYLIPILAVSITTHWILSQSLFLVAIQVFDKEGNLDVSNSILTCGFSSIAIIFLIGIGWLVLIAGIGMGLRRYEKGMPLAGSCSAAISAACHPQADEVDVSLVPVKWGVVDVDKGVGHCALSGRYVSPPITWRLYQGGTGGKVDSQSV